MIVGNDEKLLWDDNGKPVISPAGKDSVLIVDLGYPETPRPQGRSAQACRHGHRW